MFIEYTDEMKHQDKLWIDCNEDLDVMEILHNQITTQFKSQVGSDHYFLTYLHDNDEVVTEYYTCKSDDYPIFYVGRCKDLIEELKN